MKFNLILITLFFLPGAFCQFTYPNGQIKSSGDSYEGEYISYFENGQIKTKTNYVSGVEQGAHIEFNQTGDTSIIGDYKQGRRIGEWIFFHENGQRNHVDFFDENFQLQGERRWYYESGKLLVIELYVADKREGEAIMFSEDGKILKKMYYSADKKVKEIIYQTNGTIKETLTY